MDVEVQGNKSYSLCMHIYLSIQFSESGIQMLLQNLEASKSPGPDGIHPLVLKHCSYELAPILKVILVVSIQTGYLLM